MADMDCPEGTVCKGSGPPEDYEQRCEKPDGTKHGPHIKWWASGLKWQRGERTKRDEAGEIESVTEHDDDGNFVKMTNYENGEPVGE